MAEKWGLVHAGFLKNINIQRQKIESFREKDLQHTRTNLFVDASLAKHVETFLARAMQEVAQLEVDANKIKHYYESLK